MNSNPLVRPPSSAEIVVVGSCNADLLISGGDIPLPGQTVRAERLERAVGGKGLNQAVAAARAGGTVRMLAAIGADADGDHVIEVLENAGVDSALVRRGEVNTGTAVVTVGRDSDNAISVVGGANATFTHLTLDECAVVRAAAAVVLQLELPLPLVTSAAALARESGALVVLTPAPVAPLPRELLKSVNVLLANRHEALLISGAHDLDGALEVLILSVPTVIVTDGSRGCRWATAGGERGHLAAPAVRAVDTTGAGDTFAGYLVAGLVQGRGLAESARRAIDAASLSVQRAGGSPSIPLSEEVNAK
ncbi:MAG: ribokinase [Microbacterium sp.]